MFKMSSQPLKMIRACLKCQSYLKVKRSSIVWNSIEPSSRLHHCSLSQRKYFDLVGRKSYSTTAPIEVNQEQALAEEESEPAFTVSHDDYKWVRRILPPSVIPEPPKRASYPSPTGYQPPSDTVPDLPYYIARDRFHGLPVTVKITNQTRTLTHVKKVEGDIWALEKEIVELIRPSLKYDPATRVHEVTRTITIKGDHKELIVKFLLKCGF